MHILLILDDSLPLIIRRKKENRIMNTPSSIDSLLKFTFCLHILSGFYYAFILTSYNYNYNLHSIVNPLFSVLSLGSINNLSLFFKELNFTTVGIMKERFLGAMLLITLIYSMYKIME